MARPGTISVLAFKRVCDRLLHGSREHRFAQRGAANGKVTLKLCLIFLLPWTDRVDYLS